MRFELSAAALLALGSFTGSSNAFTVPLVLQRSRSAVVVQQSSNGAWDNEDFLKSLQPPKEVDAENRSVNAEDVSDQGGSRFKAMLEATTKKGATGGPIDRQPRTIPNPFLTPPPPPPPPTQQQQPPIQLDNLSVEDQARLFRQLMGQSQTGLGAAPVPYVAPVPTKQDARGGRPMGRNRDADSIANTADLYFAQLKRDSTIRTQARYQGELDKAEAVFEDERIAELNDLLRENPFLKDQVDQNRLDIESIPQAWLEPYMESEIVDEEAMTYAGVKYKDKLKEIRDKKKGGSAASATPPAATATVARVQVEAPAAVVAPPPPLPVQVQVQAPVVVQQAVSTPSPPAQTVTPPASTNAGTLSDDAKRQTLRTFMGLILKHRGGSGFGKGRLQGDDIAKFEDALNQVTTMLRQEAGATTAVAAAPSPVSQYTPVATVAPPTSPSSSVARVSGIIACIEGAILMYKNSPPEMKEGVLITLRAALVSAVNTCNTVIAESNGGAMTVNFNANSQSTASSASSGTVQIEGIIACIEGAVLMYKNSPPELQSSVLATLNGALMTAVYTCNKVIANNDLANYNSYNTVTGTVPEPVATTPSTFYAVVDEAALAALPAPSTPAVAPTPTSMGSDANTKALEEIYDDLKRASGSAKLGLNGQLSGEEASNLADKMDEMRALLMSELESGIPDPEPVQLVGDTTAPEESSSVSKYQQMLAKAKAAKSG